MRVGIAGCATFLVTAYRNRPVQTWKRLFWVKPNRVTIRILSGHGPFEDHLFRRRLLLSDSCPADLERDKAEHAVFRCKAVPDTLKEARMKIPHENPSENSPSSGPGLRGLEHTSGSSRGPCAKTRVRVATSPGQNTGCRGGLLICQDGLVR